MEREIKPSEVIAELEKGNCVQRADTGKIQQMHEGEEFYWNTEKKYWENRGVGIYIDTRAKYYAVPDPSISEAPVYPTENRIQKLEETVHSLHRRVSELEARAAGLSHLENLIAPFRTAGPLTQPSPSGTGDAPIFPSTTTILFGENK